MTTNRISSGDPKSATEIAFSPAVQTDVCPRCGAPVEHDDKFCPACGAPQIARAEVVKGPQLPQRVTCDNCGAEIHLAANQRSYTCEYCGSTYVFDFAPEVTGRQPPEFVLGFTIPPEKARAILAEWVRGKERWITRSIREAIQRAVIRGVYLPFWSFSMSAESSWRATIGEYWYRTETYTTYENGKLVTKTRQVRETEWWPLSGKYHQYLSGYLISASQKVPQNWADQLMPYHLAGLRRYDPSYLAGWACEEYTMERAQAEALCKEYFREYQTKCIAEFLPGDTYRGLTVQTQFAREDSDLILLPVYNIRFKYRNKEYRLWMNGQTGKIVGELPTSWTVPILVILAILAVVLAAYFLLR
ncbi:MAG: zinc ribbon domain-containing protein [Thermogutta sp.]